MAKEPTSEETLEALSYELIIMARMVESLPPGFQQSFREQLTNITSALSAHLHVHSAEIQEGLDDVGLHARAAIFDLEATRRERDDAKRRLNEID
jgi:hypothetical protein